MGRRAVRSGSAREADADGLPRARRARRRRPARARERDREDRDLGRPASRSASARSSCSSPRRPSVPPFALTDAWGRRDVGAASSTRASRCSSASHGRVARAARARRLARRARRSRPRVPGARGGGRPRREDAAGAAEDASVRGREGLRAGAELLASTSSRTRSSRLAELDPALKGGSRLPAELELERALVDVTRPARAAASAPARPLAGLGAGDEASRPATSCARPCSGGARRARPPCRSSGRASGAPRRPASVSPSSTAASSRFVSVLTVER